IDTVHADFLHARVDWGSFTSPTEAIRAITKYPHIELALTDCGFTKGARREWGDDQYHWRIYQWMMPAFSLLPAGGPTIAYRAAVPIDDTHTLFWNGLYCPTQPLTAEERAAHQGSRWFGGIAPSTGDPLTKRRTKCGKE